MQSSNDYTYFSILNTVIVYMVTISLYPQETAEDPRFQTGDE